MSSTVIPREKLSAYQRWELNSFDGSTAASPRAEDQAQKEQDSKRQGYEAGYRDGVTAGRTDAKRAAAVQANQLNLLLTSVNRDLGIIDTQLADHVLDLSLTVARRLAGEALRIRPELVLGMVRECLQATGQARAPAQIVMHPADAQLIREHLGEQCAAGGWIISEDAMMARGGCRLESAGGTLDASIETRWHRLTAAFGRSSEWLEQPGADK